MALKLLLDLLTGNMALVNVPAIAAAVLARLAMNGDYRIDMAGNYRVSMSQ